MRHGQFRGSVVGLQMAPHDINIARETFLAVLKQDKALDDTNYLARARNRPVSTVWYRGIGAQDGQE
jgi:hypothetical protein